MWCGLSVGYASAIDAIRVADVFSESDIAGWGGNAKKMFGLKT